MGRRRGKRTTFLQRGTLEQEAELNIDSDDEPGGLHIGGAVIYRAPMSSRMAAGRRVRAQRSSSKAGATGPGRSPTAALQQQDAEEWQWVRSEDSLDDELRDYLDNVEQHENSDSEPISTPQQQLAAELPAAYTSAQAFHFAAAAAVEGAHASVHRSRNMGFEDDAGLVSRPGLGYHLGLGFSSSAAAARFTAVGLDDALEGMLGRDMAKGLGYRSDSSPPDTDSSSNSDDNSSSSSSSDTDEDVVVGPSFDINAAVDPSAPVVVDSQGEPVAAWEQLSLQQRFPVLTRQQQQGLAAPDILGLADSSRNSSSRKVRKLQIRARNGQNNRPGCSSNSPAAWASSIKMPSCKSPAMTAAASAACAAAAAAADASAAQQQRDHKLQQQQQQRSAVKGARNGQLLPGEKKKLRKEKIAAKRAVRRAETGCSALELLSVVEEFVAGGGDMTVLPPADKHKQAFIRALANLFGVKATPRGGGSSGKTSLVLQSTSSTALLCDDDGLQLKQLQELLTAEVARELTAAAVAAGPAPGSEQKRTKSRSTPRQGLQRQGSRGTDTGAAMSVFQQPLVFVSAGVLDPNDMAAAQQDHEDTAVDATAAAAAAQDERLNLVANTTANAAAAADPAPDPSSAAAGSSGPHSSSTATNDIGAFLESLLLDTDEKQQQQQDGDSVAAGAAQPGEGHTPHIEEEHHRQQPSELAAGACVLDREAHSAAVVASTPGSLLEATPSPPQQAAGAMLSTPRYERVSTGLGFGGSSSSTQRRGLGFVANSSGLLQADNTDMLLHPSAAGSGSGVARGASCSAEGPARQPHSSSSKVLQDLERKFHNLRAIGNPHATRRQQRKQQRDWQQAGPYQQHQQQQLERRLSNPNTAVGPTIRAGVEQSAGNLISRSSDRDGSNLGIDHDLQEQQQQYLELSSLTLGLTAQQVKKAKKQQQRNQRREARAAAGGVPAAAEHVQGADVGSGNVSNSFASFEAHTTGIGSRLLGRWGWSEGEGLGRARHGRAEPLQAARRPKQLGLGAE